MDQELISKKELLETFGISYGALYRWKRMGLIPEAWFLRRSTSTGQETFFRRDQICQRVRLILDNKEHQTLDELAAEAGLAPKYLCRVFRQVTGRTPIDYLNYYRIECAAELLCTTTDSITDVALSCGFNDPSYFSRMFRRQKRVSAHVYRNQYSEGG